MMILKLVLVCALIAGPTLGSAVKGRERSEFESKGRLSNEPRREELQQRELEPAKLLPAEELPVQQQPIKSEELAGGKRHEARPQLSREEPAEVAKEKPREEQSPLKAAPAAERKGRAEEQAAAEERDQQQQVELSQQQEQTELRVDGDAQFEQQRELPPQQEVVAGPLFEEQQKLEVAPPAAAKGAPLERAAPIGEAEPYAFGYQVEGSSRQESGDSRGVVRGQYSLQGADGASRIVDYVADHNGFRATVQSNEFGTETLRSPANVVLRNQQPSKATESQRHESKTRELHRVEPSLLPAVRRDYQYEVAPVEDRYAGLKTSVGQRAITEDVGLLEPQVAPVVAQRPAAQVLTQWPPAEESPRGTKGFSSAAKATEEQRREELPVAREDEQKEIQLRPAKGQRVEEPSAQIKVDDVKSAPLKAPKAPLRPAVALRPLIVAATQQQVGGSRKEQAPAEPRTRFESATAHLSPPSRAFGYRPAPAVPLVRSGAQLARAPAQQPAAHLTQQRNYEAARQLPPSPVRGGYRRHQLPADPRISLYSSPEDVDLIGFAEQ